MGLFCTSLSKQPAMKAPAYSFSNSTCIGWQCIVCSVLKCFRDVCCAQNVELTSLCDVFITVDSACPNVFHTRWINDLHLLRFCVFLVKSIARFGSKCIWQACLAYIFLFCHMQYILYSTDCLSICVTKFTPCLWTPQNRNLWILPKHNYSNKKKKINK